MKRPGRNSADSHRQISRRGLILGSGMLTVAGVLAARMRYLQVDQADQYRLLADENRIKIRLIPPGRGQIFDREGRVIAENVPSYRIMIDGTEAGDVDQVIARLSEIIRLDPEVVDRARKELHRSRIHPVTIAERVSWDELSRVAVNAPALPGVQPEVGLSRRYPRGEDYAHLVGYVGPVSDRDLESIRAPDQLLLIPRFQIGKIGIEKLREDILRGNAGTRRVEQNAAGRELRELDRQEGQAGKNIQLTTDNALQRYCKMRMKGESAAAVVIDVATGDILASASTPAFDPNLFVRGISVSDYRALLDNKFRPLPNKTSQGAYPPGSTFKMVAALAALEGGFIDPQETVRCVGYLEVSGRRFHCWKRSGHGNVDLQKSIKESCDVYFYDLALKTGIENIAVMARRMGLGTAFDLPLTSVNEGLIPTKEWKKRTKGEEWVIGDSINSVIGQGYVLTSPLQLAVMTARLATGRSVTPRLIKSVDGVETPTGAGTDLGLNPNHLIAVRKAMYSVSNERRGTAYASRIVEEGFRMAGKTGTSQVRNITTAERAQGVIRNEDLPWERRDHALYVNYAPADNPRIAVAVVVEHGGGGSTAAAPVARDITLQALYGGDPPLDAYPAAAQPRARAMQERIRRERELETGGDPEDQA